MKKRGAIILGILGILLVALVSAAIYQEPWIQNQLGDKHNLTDMGYISSININGSNAFFEFLNVSGGLTDPINWTNLQNYPAACPGSSAVTTLNDSVYCSDLWVDVAGDTMSGNLTFTNNSELLNLSYIENSNWSNVSVVEGQISDLQTYSINNTWGWILNFTNIFSENWGNITITESQINDLQIYSVNNTRGWILNLTEVFSMDWTNVTITEGQIEDFGNYTVNNSLGWILNFTNIYSHDWTNITITESQMSDLVHTVNETNLNVYDVNATSATISGDTIVNGTFYLNDTIGMTGNYSVGYCWIDFIQGMAKSTNCTAN